MTDASEYTDSFNDLRRAMASVWLEIGPDATDEYIRCRISFYMRVHSSKVSFMRRTIKQTGTVLWYAKLDTDPGWTMTSEAGLEQIACNGAW